MRNIFKAVVGILAVITFFNVDRAWATNYYSVRDRAINLSVALDEVPAPFGQGTIMTGTFRNEANGFTGTITTFYKSEATGTQILEFSWDANGCIGKYFVVPIRSAGGKGASSMFQNQNSGSLVLNFIAGASCEGPLEKLKLVLGDGYYGNGIEENHVHINNQCPHLKKTGQSKTSSTSHGKGGNETGNNNSGSNTNGANVNVNVNNGNTNGKSGGSEVESNK